MNGFPLFLGLHVQLMDDASITAAAGIPFRWDDIDVETDTDPTSPRNLHPTPTRPRLPANGQIFTAP